MSGAIQQTRPLNRKEFMNKLVVPYDKEIGNPNSVFSDPQKLGQPEINRAYETSVKGDTDKDYKIGIKDIDEAVLYYFNNVLKLSVTQNNTKQLVPIIYGNQENWKAVQQDGYLRDKSGKLLAPLLMFKRNTITQNRNLGNKLDGNQVHNFQYFESSFNRRNAYGNFNIINNRVPEKKYIVSITPDYITVDYTCIMWTYFVEQMDSLIESLNFSSRSYWGDPNRFLFYSSIDSFQENLTYELGEDRAVKNEFSISLNGYLIPDTVNKKMANATRAYGVSQIFFGLETANSTEQFNATVNAPTTNARNSVRTTDSVNNVNMITGGSDPAAISYATATVQATGTVSNSTTVTFPKTWLSAPSGMPATSVANFSFFCNGNFIDTNSITSFTTDGVSISTLVINPTSLQYTFDSQDIIIAIGKFK